MVDLPGLIYEGPPLEEAELATTDLPANFAGLLRQINGFVCLHGGFHVRGFCRAPAWHALSTVTEGPRALHAHYRSVQPGDLPFGEESLGDQFLLRDGEVHRLYTETDQIEALSIGLGTFLGGLASEAIFELPDFLYDWYSQGRLTADKAVQVYPPFAAAKPESGYSFAPVPRLELLDYHIELSKQIRDLPEGTRFRIDVTE